MDIFWYFVIGVGVYILLNQSFMAFIRYKDEIEAKEKRERQAEIARQQRELMDKRFDELLNDPTRFNQYFAGRPVMDKPAKQSIVSKDGNIKNKTSENSRTSNEGDFATSMAVAAVTDSAMIGYIAGGSLSGAIVGDALNNSDTSYGSTSDYTSTTDSSSSWDSSSSSSSWDSGSSFDSGSSSSGGSDW